MIYQVYSVRDELSGFQSLFLHQSDPLALRDFEAACSRIPGELSPMRFRPTDFALYHVGTFDTASGSLSPLSPIEVVARGGKIDA